MADAITNLANRDLITQSQGIIGSPTFELDQASAASKELDQLMSLLPGSTGSPDPDATERALLRVLTIIARMKSASGSFGSFNAAKAWFEAQR